MDVLAHTVLRSDDVAADEVAPGVRASNQLRRMLQYGHSQAVGASGADGDRDTVTRQASILNVREYNRAKGGAMVTRSNVDPDANGNGGWQTMFQTFPFRARSYGTIAAAAQNATTLTLTKTASAAVPAVGQRWNVGRGTNAEIVTISNVSGTGPYTLTITGGGGANGGLAEAKLASDPAYEVPYEWQSGEALVSIWYMLNDIARVGSASGGTGAVETGKNAIFAAMKACLALAQCAEFYTADHPIFTRSTVAAATASTSGASVRGWVRYNNEAPNVVTIDLPANFDGTDVYVFYASNLGSGRKISFTVDGVAQPQFDHYTKNIHESATFYNASVAVLSGLTPGRHVIVATTSEVEAANTAFNFVIGCGIKAKHPPIIIVPGVARPASYAFYNGTDKPNAPITGTVNANHGIGVQSFTVTTPTFQYGGTGTPTFRQGEFITFGKGTANEETLEIAANATGTTVTTKTASTKAHDTGEAYLGNMQDATITLRAKTWATELAAMFSSNVIPVELDDLTGGVAAYHIWDGIHYNEEGSSVATLAKRNAIERSPAVTPAKVARTAVPPAPLPSETVWFSGGTAVVPSSIGGAGSIVDFATTGVSLLGFIRRADLRRVAEFRILAFVVANANPGQRLALHYSVDGRVTWKTMAKKPTGYDLAITDSSGNVDLTTTGEKETAWLPTPLELGYYPDVQMRLVLGNRTSGTSVPTFAYIIVQWR